MHLIILIIEPHFESHPHHTTTHSKHTQHLPLSHHEGLPRQIWKRQRDKQVASWCKLIVGRNFSDASKWLIKFIFERIWLILSVLILIDLKFHIYSLSKNKYVLNFRLLICNSQFQIFHFQPWFSTILIWFFFGPLLLILVSKDLSLRFQICFPYLYMPC